MLFFEQRKMLSDWKFKENRELDEEQIFSSVYKDAKS